MMAKATYTPSSFGAHIRWLRTTSHMTQRELATLLAVDPTYISKIENMTYENPPSVGVIHNLAYYLNADAEYLQELCGKLDKQALMDIAQNNPTAASVLRRLQSGVSQATWQRIAELLEQSA